MGDIQKAYFAHSAMDAGIYLSMVGDCFCLVSKKFRKILLQTLSWIIGHVKFTLFTGHIMTDNFN